ncbi:beta-galactosidase GalB [Sphingosinicella sp. LHD-64]|uniref:beta-galactosidase GalB n=1 Tax=Sphingosinicella sp. LHD-64 TaxID=3072139 RepID=UPI0028105261|nr:beta-galactosidase GalB [Sphingosinicella sp. LHD-64]MDQ8755184.1 beta-galactosidase GalB [Sphingosinicella sp. LHD-64]
MTAKMLGRWAKWMHGRVGPGVAALAVLLSLIVPGSQARAQPAETPRERILISTGWRFTRGDPPGNTTDLRYDVRPEVVRSADGRVADAQPEEAVRVGDAGRRVLRPWILPSANRFIADPARRHVRPDGDPGSEVPYVRPEFDDSGWQRADLPHDWAIAGPFIEEGPYGGMGRLPSWGIGWYRRALDIPAGDAGKSIFLDVEGAMAYATVWLNGRLIGGWPYGYNSWRLDLTPYVRFGGRNQLVIRLDNPPESSRWYPGGGLYRDVWLVKTRPVHVAQWGGFVTTPEVSREAATVALQLAIDNDAAQEAAIEVATEIYALDADGRRTGQPVAQIAPQAARVAARGTTTIQGTARIATPRLWGPPPTQRPHLYVAVSTVRQDERIVDRYETPFGIRTLRFDADQGLFVNGERIPIRGVNNHHDLGALGAAFNRRAAERQLELLREMGANAIRMSHNPPAPALLELADRMGFLVIDEVFDVWERRKTPLDFHLVFPDWHEPDLRAMVRRDRNHPSVILWSIGNEVGEQYTGEDGAGIARRLAAIAREEDPSRLTTTAMNWARPDMPLPGTVDVIGLNYQGTGVRTLPGQFQAFHDRFPDTLIFASESASALSSRGEYLFPVPGSVSGPVRPGSGGDPRTRQVSAYELHAADFGSTPDRDFSAQDQHPFVAGEFVWTGFDYLGEPTPYYDARSAYSGIFDLAGFRKDRFYLYQARWRPDLRFAHILPHWTWPGREGEVTPVHVFSSADEAELFVNGRSQGRIRRAPFAYRFRWDYVTYEPGELRVVTWKNGQEWATATMTTAGPPTALAAEVDRRRIHADGRDLAFVTVRVTDAAGRTAPRADNAVRFTVEGPGELVATDNGDPTSFVEFASPTRPAFNGLALAIVRARPGEAGRITLRAETEGLEGASVVIETRRNAD